MAMDFYPRYACFRFYSSLLCSLLLREEGTLTCVAAVGLFFIISDFPEEATWRTPEEKAFVKARLEDDIGSSGRDEKMKLEDILRPFKDCKWTAFRAFVVLTNSRQELCCCIDVFWAHCACLQLR